MTRQPAPFAGRIAHISRRPLPDNDTASIQMVQTASALVRAGVVLDLVIPRAPWHAARPVPVLRQEFRKHFGAECDFGIREIPSRLVPIQLIAHPLHAILATRATPPSRYAAIHTRDAETALLGVTRGRRVLFETYRTLTRQSPLHRAMVRRAAAAADFLGLVTHSNYARECYLADGFPPQKIRTIYNGFDPAPFAVRRTPVEARRALGLREGITVVYAGRIAPLKRIDLLLDAAERTPELHWVLAGERESREATALVQRGSALPNVSFTGYLTGERLTLALQSADILVIPPSVDPLERSGRTVLPIKVFQYLGVGRAIITGDLPDTAELLIHDRNCVRVPPDQVEALIDTVRALAADPGRRERLGEAARLGGAGLTWDARGRALLAFIEERMAELSRLEGQ